MHQLCRDLFLAALEVQARHTLLSVLIWIPHTRIRLNGTREQAEISHLAHEWVGSGLPDIGSQGSRVRGYQLLFAIFSLRSARGSVQRRGQEINNIVKQCNRADLASTGRAEDRYKGSSVDNIF